MSDIPNSAFRLCWRRTWPDRPDHFSAQKGDAYCRIYRMDGGPQDGRWCWTAARDASLGTGHRDTAREAALEAEQEIEIRLVLSLRPPAEVFGVVNLVERVSAQ